MDLCVHTSKREYSIFVGLVQKEVGDITNDLKTQAKSMSAEEQEKRKQETEKR